LQIPISFNQKKYPTSEHLYQSLKYIYEGASDDSLKYATHIQNAKTPNISKILANQKIAGGYKWRTNLNPLISQYISKGVAPRQDWDLVKVEVMRSVLRLKFRTDKHCRDILLSSENQTLVEKSSQDSFWGEGKNGKGSNMLGKLLEEIREELGKELEGKESYSITTEQLSQMESNRLIAVARKRKRELSVETVKKAKCSETSEKCSIALR